MKAKGATAGQVAKAAKLANQLKGKEIARDVETPFEKFNRELKNLRTTALGGGMDMKTFERAKTKLVGELQRSLPESKASAGGAMLANSAEARSAVLNFRNAARNADPAVQLKRVAEMQLQEQKMASFWLRELVKAQPAVNQFAGL